MIDSTYGKPSPNTQALYNDAYNVSGLPKIRQSIASIDEKISKLQNDTISAIDEQNNDPWISQATRNARIARAQQIATGRLDALNNTRSALIDQYNSGVDEIEKSVKRVNDDFLNENKLNVDHLNVLLNEAEKQATLTTNDNKKATLRYVPDFLKSSADKKADDVEKKLQNDIRLEQAKNGVGATTSAMADIIAKNPSYAAFTQGFTNVSRGLSSQKYPPADRLRDLQSLNSYLATGDTKSAQELLVDIANSHIEGKAKEDAIKRNTVIDGMIEIKGMLSDYTAKYGDTGLLSGTMGNVLNSLGKAQNGDAEYIKGRITTILQDYRNEVTGAAWGEQETDEYNRIIPGLSSDNKFNVAKIDSLVDSMSLKNDKTYEAYIGKGNYQKIIDFAKNGGSTPTAQSTSDFLDQLVGGNTMVAGSSNADLEALWNGN